MNASEMKRFTKMKTENGGNDKRRVGEERRGRTYWEIGWMEGGRGEGEWCSVRCD